MHCEFRISKGGPIAALRIVFPFISFWSSRTSHGGSSCELAVGRGGPMDLWALFLRVRRRLRDFLGLLRLRLAYRGPRCAPDGVSR